MGRGDDEVVAARRRAAHEGRKVPRRLQPQLAPERLGEVGAQRHVAAEELHRRDDGEDAETQGGRTGPGVRRQAGAREAGQQGRQRQGGRAGTP